MDKTSIFGKTTNRIFIFLEEVSGNEIHDGYNSGHNCYALFIS